MNPPYRKRPAPQSGSPNCRLAGGTSAIRWAICAATMLGGCALAESQSLQGAGATFPAPLYARWISQYNANNKAVSVDYQANGSGAGIKGITDKTVQFAGSDAPMSDNQLAEAHDAILHIPTVAGAIVMVYNLPGVERLTLNGEVIADIFLGTITKWNDAKIAAINAGATLPDKEIVVVHRSDGSGITFTFSNYLCKVNQEWKSTVGNATALRWPTGFGGKGCDGIGGNVCRTEGAIGYLELVFARHMNLSVASVINADEKDVQAASDHVVAAAANTSEIPDDLRVSITNAPGETSYPICGFTYLLVHQDLSYLKNRQQALELVKFLYWCTHDAQDSAAEMGYARLPENLRIKVTEKLKTIVYDGETLLK